MKNTLSILLAIFLCCSMGATAQITWSLSHDTLYITGTGPMPEYSSTDAPWIDYRDQYRHVVVRSGVTTIGQNAFLAPAGLISAVLETVTLEEGVTEIHYGAFSANKTLQTVSFPTTLTSVGELAFAGCTALQAVDLPEAMTAIGRKAFDGCSALDSVIIRATSLTTYGEDAFKSTNGALRIFVPEEAVDTYKAGWSAYADKIQAIPPQKYYHFITRSWENDALEEYEDSISELHPDFQLITSTGGSIDLTKHYNVVAGDVTVGGHLFVKTAAGTPCYIILADNAHLHVNGITFPTWNNHLDLYICAEEGGEQLGKLSSSDIIGNTDINTEGRVHIHGGDIYAKGRGSDPGIGTSGSTYMKSGDVYIYSGIIEASSEKGAGIGGSSSAYGLGTIRIYGGTISATGGASPGGAGIGGSTNCYDGTIEIYGGDITATGGHEAAGIGTTQDAPYNNMTVRVYAGSVVARGGNYAAGIGGGDGISGCTVEISGGYVEAHGGVDAAGIGGGEGGNGGTVTISGGEVKAYGNDNGAGIGGGEDADGAKVTITGGTVIAQTTGTDDGSRAIGPGDGSDNYGSLTLGDDLMVTSERKAAASERKGMCWYRTNVRVEPCDHEDVTYTVDGNTAADHHISHCPYCLRSDTALHTFDEHNRCTVCGVEATIYPIATYLPELQQGAYDGETYYRTPFDYIVPNSDYLLPECTVRVPKLSFIGWEPVTDAQQSHYTSPYTTDTTKLYQPGEYYRITDHTNFVARYQLANITLYAEESNNEVLAQYDNLLVNSVTLSGHTFTNDNTWQTLCLPFSLSAEEVANSPLAGAEIKQLDLNGTYDEHQTGYDLATNTLYLYFEDTNAIAAGRPYVIRWANANAEDPVFDSVTILKANANANAPYMVFTSLYSPKTFVAANDKAIYIGANNAFFRPDGTEVITINAFRGYFRLNYFGSASEAPFTIVTNLDGAVVPTGIEDGIGIGDGHWQKVLRNGILLIEKNGTRYTITGQKVK